MKLSPMGETFDGHAIEQEGFGVIGCWRDYANEDPAKLVRLFCAAPELLEQRGLTLRADTKTGMRGLIDSQKDK